MARMRRRREQRGRSQGGKLGVIVRCAQPVLNETCCALEQVRPIENCSSERLARGEGGLRQLCLGSREQQKRKGAERAAGATSSHQKRQRRNWLGISAQVAAF